MVKQRTFLIRLDAWLFLFIFLHITAWTLAPILVRLNLPMDSIENTIWALHFDWGYDKNPFINSGLTRLALTLDGHSGWMLYLFSQLMVGMCFWAIWQLGKSILPPMYALLSVLVLETMQYYNFHAIDFSDNTIELCMWSLTILFFYQSVKHNRRYAWLLTGLFAGLGMMTKYYTAALLLPMLLFLLIHPNARPLLKKSGPYWGLGVFVLTILPNCLWLIQHDFITIRYALIRTESEPHWLNHLIFPLQFAWQQCLVCIPMMIVIGLLCLGKQKPKSFITTDPNDLAFLIYMGLGPFLITLTIAAIMGFQLHAAWGQPLLSLIGMILIAYCKPNITPSKFYCLMTMLLSLFILAIFMYCHSLIHPKATSSSIFPGKEIANALTTDWNNRYHTPLKYIAGSRWLSGNIAFYSKDHPDVFIDWNKQISLAIDEQKLHRSGAIFVWDLSEIQYATPDEIKQRFATLGAIQTMQFQWHRNKALPPVTFLVAYLPPTEDIA